MFRQMQESFMPNGHGTPPGCGLGKHYQHNDPESVVGFCHYHRIEVHIDIVCTDCLSKYFAMAFSISKLWARLTLFVRSLSGLTVEGNAATHLGVLSEGVLYAFVDVEGHGYPPPTELVPLAKILDYKDWDNEHRQHAWANAQKHAIMLFEKRKGNH